MRALNSSGVLDETTEEGRLSYCKIISDLKLKNCRRPREIKIMQVVCPESSVVRLFARSVRGPGFEFRAGHVHSQHTLVTTGEKKACYPNLALQLRTARRMCKYSDH